MSVSVAAVMRHCRNYFETGYLDGTFRITGNALSADTGGVHFVYISGSLMHDGVWEMCDGYLTGRSVEGMHDEEFTGRVWLLAPPVDFLELCKIISDYEEKNPVTALSSESFGGYSRTWNAEQIGKGWSVAFNASLIPYRHMFTEVQ
jgi:hypothetical protein